jgi:hypothetical protein
LSTGHVEQGVPQVGRTTAGATRIQITQESWSVLLAAATDHRFFGTERREVRFGFGVDRRAKQVPYKKLK